MDKVMITVAPTGSQPTKEQHPHLPTTPAEIAQAAYECYNEGAAIVHIHTRDPQTGGRSTAIELYAEAMEKIRAQCDMIINLTTSTGGQLIVGPDNQIQTERTLLLPPEKRVEHILKLKPEMCSLDVGSANARWGVFLNVEAVIDKMAELIQKAGVKPEVEVFDVGHIQIAKRLLQLGLLERNAHFQLCMGTRMGVPGDPKNALHMAECLPPGVTWSIFGVAATQIPMVAMGVLMGGHVRVGFEDNLYIAKGKLAKSNAELVARAAQIIRNLNKEVASVEEARTILGLKKP
jgi:uncharacterized protein (DUF849 family)